MNTLRKLWLTVVCAAVLTSVLPALAGPSWNDVYGKMNGLKDYHINYDYDGPQGNYKFDYVFSNGGDINTTILKSKSDPSKKGTKIIYKKGAKQVIASTGSGTIARNLDHKDVVGRPFHESIWTMIFNQLPSKGKAAPKTTADWGSGGSKFIWSGYTIYADSDGQIVKTERKADRVPETREFTWK